MQSAAPRDNEADTLAALRALAVLDSAPEAEFDALARLAAGLCGVPMAAISLVDAERQWFKANVGLSGVAGGPRSSAFCAHAVRRDELFEVPDATSDERFADNPLVAGDPGIRFYAGAPVTVDGGCRVGTVCVIDRTPRQLTGHQRDALQDLAVVVGRALERRAASARLDAHVRALAERERALRLVLDAVPSAMAYWDADLRCHFANPTHATWFGIGAEAVRGTSLRQVVGAASYEEIRPRVEAALRGERQEFERVAACADGTDRHVLTFYSPDLLDGQVLGFLVQVIDVTPLKAVEQKLRHETLALQRVVDLQRTTEQQLRQVTDNLPALIAYLDREERFRFANEVHATWLGRSPAQLRGMSLLEVFGSTAYAAFGHHVRRALDGERLDFTHELATLQGRRHVDVNVVPDIDEHGRVLGLYVMMIDITALKETQRRLDRLARADVLTGLPNRRRFDEGLREAMARTRATGVPMAVMFLDIDRFKRINDSWGHAAGDAVLQQFATRLRHQVRGTDLVARLAGDEFVVLVEGMQAVADAEALAEKIVRAIRPPFDVAGRALAVTTSVGVTRYHGGDQAPGDLLAAADRALYRAKELGRDCHAVWPGAPTLLSA